MFSWLGRVSSLNTFPPPLALPKLWLVPQISVKPSPLGQSLFWTSGLGQGSMLCAPLECFPLPFSSTHQAAIGSLCLPLDCKFPKTTTLPALFTTSSSALLGAAHAIEVHSVSVGSINLDTDTLLHMRTDHNMKYNTY